MLIDPVPHAYSQHQSGWLTLTLTSAQLYLPLSSNCTCSELVGGSSAHQSSSIPIIWLDCPPPPVPPLLYWSLPFWGQWTLTSDSSVCFMKQNSSCNCLSTKWVRTKISQPEKHLSRFTSECSLCLFVCWFTSWSFEQAVCLYNHQSIISLDYSLDFHFPKQSGFQFQFAYLQNGQLNLNSWCNGNHKGELGVGLPAVIRVSNVRTVELVSCCSVARVLFVLALMWPRLENSMSFLSLQVVTMGLQCTRCFQWRDRLNTLVVGDRWCRPCHEL